MGGSKSCGVSRIDFDEEAWFFRRDEAGVFGFPDDQGDLRISCTDRRMTTCWASPRYTLVLSVDTISSTAIAICSLQPPLLLSLGPEVRNGTPHLIPGPEYMSNTKDVNLKLSHEHLRD